jgi:large subunit ribosomal protein L22
MEVKAKAKFIRMSPRKVRLVVDVIRNKTALEALEQLQFINKRAVRPLEKLLNSAIANAKHDYEIEQDNLYIKDIRVDEGPTLHRWMARAHGRATPIRKRTSHIRLILDEIEEIPTKKKKKRDIKAPVKMDKRPKEDDGVRVKSKKGARKGEAEEDAREIEKGKRIIDPRREGRGKHVRIEGKSEKGFGTKFFRRKSG